MILDDSFYTTKAHLVMNKETGVVSAGVQHNHERRQEKRIRIAKPNKILKGD